MAAIQCGKCGLNEEPMVGLSDSGQAVKLCARCSNQLSMALTPPNAAMSRASEDGFGRVATAALPMAAPIAPPAPPTRITNGHAVYAPLRRTAPAPAPRAPREPNGDSAADILQARLDDVEAEIAHLEIEASRLVGLRAEAKHVRKQLAATVARERVTKALAAIPAEPSPQADLFKN